MAGGNPMTRNRQITIATVAGALAGAVAFGPAAMAEAEAPRTMAAGATATPVLDARSALLTAIALGYPEVRRAGMVGDHYQVEAVDATGSTVRLVMDPENGVVLRIERDKTDRGM
jgi:hypothetical protein